MRWKNNISVSEREFCHRTQSMNTGLNLHAMQAFCDKRTGPVVSSDPLCPLPKGMNRSAGAPEGRLLWNSRVHMRPVSRFAVHHHHPSGVVE